MKIKMPTSKEEFILRVLIGRGRLYAGEIVSVSKVKLKPGGVGGQLRGIEEKGLVTSEFEETANPNGPRRKFYMATEYGRKIVSRIDEMNKEIFNL